MDDNVGRNASVVNQPIPLPLNYDTSAPGGNGVSVSDPEGSVVSGIPGGCWKWTARKWWSGCKCEDLIRAIMAILYQVLRNVYRVFGL